MGYETDRQDFATIFKDIVLNASNTTVSVPLFVFTGIVYCRFFGMVTAQLSNNITAVHLRGEDGTNTPAITLATGVALSSVIANSEVARRGLVGAALILSQADQLRVGEHATSGMHADTWVKLIAKNGVTNQVVMRYSTTNTPASGTMRWGCDWWTRHPSGLVIPA